MFILGCVAFALFFLSDLNDARLKRRELVFLFPAGGVLLALACVFQLWSVRAPAREFLGVLCVLLALAALAGEIYVLFFALPKGSYNSPGDVRPVFTGGFYSLCRHPGVWFLALMMLFLWLGVGFSPLALIVYTVLNVALVLFEDRYVFPLVLSGYDEYRKSTPFLLPSPAGLKEFWAEHGKRAAGR